MKAPRRQATHLGLPAVAPFSKAEPPRTYPTSVPSTPRYGQGRTPRAASRPASREFSPRFRIATAAGSPRSASEGLGAKLAAPDELAMKTDISFFAALGPLRRPLGHEYLPEPLAHTLVLSRTTATAASARSPRMPSPRQQHSARRRRTQAGPAVGLPPPSSAWPTAAAYDDALSTPSAGTFLTAPPANEFGNGRHELGAAAYDHDAAVAALVSRPWDEYDSEAPRAAYTDTGGSLALPLLDSAADFASALSIAPPPEGARVIASTSTPASANANGTPNANPSRVRPSTFSPLSRRPGERSFAYSETTLVDALRRVTWFSSLPTEQLRTLASRGRLESVGRYRTIIREGTRGMYFYILLHGQVHCTSQVKKGLSVRLTEGACFGEGALITTVQREASVTAIEPCRLMLLTADDMAGLDVELSSARYHVISLILEGLFFFRDLLKPQQDELAKCMEFAFFSRQDVIFEEDDPGDAMYAAHPSSPPTTTRGISPLLTPHALSRHVAGT